MNVSVSGKGDERNRQQGYIFINKYIPACFGQPPANVSSNPLTFDRPPPIGFVISLDDQIYEMIDHEVWTCKDGEKTFLLEWETVCPVCDSTFRLKTATAFKPTRRCEKCRRPGKPVKGKRGRRVRVAIQSQDHAA